MTAKMEIVKRLGEQAVLLPSLIADALSANDRIKLRLTMLQQASAVAAGSPAPSLDAERREAGLSDPQLDRIVSGARAIDGKRFAIPGVTALLAGVPEDIAAMLAPVEVVDPKQAKSLSERFDALRTTFPAAEDDVIDGSQIPRLTSARRGEKDSLHLLVMDTHKAINRIAAATAVEVIDGAHVHHLDPEGKVRVAAFMRGLNRTAYLAFGHPGLSTTATSAGARLTIQNDIGATDAHVLVIHIEGLSVSVTYTDVHRARSKFFASMFRAWHIDWSALTEREAAGLGKEDVFFLITGRLTVASCEEFDAFLTFLGSRIVFLIDWNKARKALQTFVGGKVAINLLSWATDTEVGHRAFLELGGVDLVFEVIRHVAAGRIPYGARLDAVLGDEESLDFLRRVLKATSRGLHEGRSARLIRDQIQADLAQRFDSAETAALVLIERHLGLSRSLASAIWTALAHKATKAERAALVLRAKRIEAKADQLTILARDACSRLRDAEELRLVVDEVENAMDSFDESAFLISLLPEGESWHSQCEQLMELADVAMRSTCELVKAVAATTRLPEGQRIDAAFALQAIDAVSELERNADAAERSALAAFLAVDGADVKTCIIAIEIARAIESATDCLSHAAHALRDRVLQELSA